MVGAHDGWCDDDLNPFYGNCEAKFSKKFTLKAVETFELYSRTKA